METVNHKLILLIDDNIIDYKTISRAIEKAQLSISIKYLSSGLKALDYLNECVNKQQPLPQLILLDINMPGMNGIEFLELIKSSKQLCHVPVVMLTSSSDEKDVISCYEKHANGYIQKPIDFDRLLQCVKSFKGFWIDYNIVPTNSI